MAVTLVHRVSFFDNATRNLAGARGVDTLTIDGRTFLYVAGEDDDGVSVFEVSAAGGLSNTDNVADAADPLDPESLLAGASDVHTLFVDGQPFMFATGPLDGGANGFAALANGSLLHSDSFSDVGGIIFQLSGARGVTSSSVLGNTFLFVAGQLDDGIEVLSVANNGALAHADSTNDAEGAAFQLLGVTSLATATVSDNFLTAHYLFAAGTLDDGISVFGIAADGELIHVDSVDDTESAALRLDGVRALATAAVGAKTFLFAASIEDDGISVFEVALNGVLDNVSNFNDVAGGVPDNIFAMTTAKIAGTTYLFVPFLGSGASGDDGVRVFAVAADGTLVSMTSLLDNGTFAMEVPEGVATGVVDGTTFLFVTGAGDDGVSVFRIDTTGLTINGTGGNDVINALNSAPGELLPSELGDVINGLGGNDTLEGLGGDDVITGGNGRDIQLGGAGSDRFDFNTAGESKKGSQRDRLEDFKRGQDDIDLRTIDAKTGSGNQKFTFIGKDDFNDVKGELRIKDLGANVIVQGDRNGDGNADFEIFVNVGSLSKGDFLL